MAPSGLSNGLLLCKSPYTRSITVAALLELTAVHLYSPGICRRDYCMRWVV